MTVCILLFLGNNAAFAQNTKGDKPVPNQQKVRQTKAKSVKKKERGVTRDIAGRRLRTKNKSSVSRANSSFPQPDPYSKRKVVKSDRAAPPRGPIYSEPPRKSERPWRGSISGSSIKRIQPRTTEYARNNIYPQSGPFVNHSSARKVTGKDIAWKGNIRGNQVQVRKPTEYKRKLYPQTGRALNYSSQNSSYVGKPISNRREIMRVAKMSKSSVDAKPSQRKVVTPRSSSKAYMTRGRKNVYWGKYIKSGKVITTDIAGLPLRTRNFQSRPIGLVEPGYDPYFGRKRISDKPYGGKISGGYVSGSRAGQAWKGDVSGRKIRRNVTGRDPETAGEFFFPRKLSTTKKGERVAKPIPGSGFQSVSGKSKSKIGKPVPSRPPGESDFLIAKDMKGRAGRNPITGGGSASGKLWNNKQSPIPVRTGGPNGSRAASYQGNFKRGELSPGFTSQGVNYSGNIKTRRQPEGGGSVSGKLWNNNRTPIPVRMGGPNGSRAASFQGNFKRGELSPGFTSQGVNYSGNIKTRRQPEGGGSASGKLWNNKQSPIPVRTGGPNGSRAASYQGNFKRGELSPGFTSQGVNYSGNIKTRRPPEGGGSVSGKLWNNNRTPIPVRTGGPNGSRAASFQGNFKRGELSPGFTSQGVNYTGNIKTRRPPEGGGSVSGKLWNNKQTPLASRPGGQEGSRAAAYSGSFKRGELSPGFSAQGVNSSGNIRRSDLSSGFSVQGADYTGNIKAKKPQVGGGSVSGKLWNNKQTPIASRLGGQEGSKAAAYSGSVKRGELSPGFSVQGADYTGNIKAKKPLVGGGSVSGKLWNNKETPIVSKTGGRGTAKAAEYTGTFKQEKPNASFSKQGGDFSGHIKSKKPVTGGGSVSGTLWNNKGEAIAGGFVPQKNDIRLARYADKTKKGFLQPAYIQNRNASSMSIKQERSESNSAKAGEYARVMKMHWNLKQNPNSADGAMRVISPSKAVARINDYQGNIKMHRYNEKNSHPDSKYAHLEENNVDKERTIFTSLRLFWSNLFRKNESQPNSLKDKPGKPRYDKGEKGLWYN